MLRKLLAKISGNKPVQRLLNYVIFVCQYFQGIGSGSSVGDSGEEAVFTCLLERCQRPCILDVGANKGQFLKMALRRVGQSQVAIHCFEPSKAAFAELGEVAAHDPRVWANPCALGREVGEARLYYDAEASELASMSKRNLDHLGIDFEHSETIRVETVQAYCAQNGIDCIDLLKMDVEGHELDVLAGALNMFKRHAVSMVLFEFGGANIDSRTFFRDFYTFFRQCDMDIFRITPSGYLMPIREYSEQCEQFRTTNFICIRQDWV